MSAATLSLFTDESTFGPAPEPWSCDQCGYLQNHTQEPLTSVVLEAEAIQTFGWRDADGGQFCSFNCLYRYVHYEPEESEEPKYTKKFPALAKTYVPKPAKIAKSTKYPSFGNFVPLAESKMKPVSWADACESDSE